MIDWGFSEGIVLFCAFVMSSTESISPVQWLLSQVSDSHNSLCIKEEQDPVDVLTHSYPYYLSYISEPQKQYQLPTSENLTTKISNTNCQKFIFTDLFVEPFFTCPADCATNPNLRDSFRSSQYNIEDIRNNNIFPKNILKRVENIVKERPLYIPNLHINKRKGIKKSFDKTFSSPVQDRMVTSVSNDKSDVSSDFPRKLDKKSVNCSYLQKNNHKPVVNCVTDRKNTPLTKIERAETSKYSQLLNSKICLDNSRAENIHIQFTKENRLSENQSVHSLEEVGQILENALQKHTPSKKNKQVPTQNGGENGGSDTGYSSRCSTPPTSLQPGVHPTEEEKHNRTKGNPSEWAPLPLIDKIEPRRSSSPSDGSVSSFGSGDSLKSRNNFTHYIPQHQYNYQHYWPQNFGNHGKPQKFHHSNDKNQKNPVNRQNYLPREQGLNYRNGEGYHNYRKYGNRHPPSYTQNPHYGFNQGNHPSQIAVGHPNGQFHNKFMHHRQNFNGHWNPPAKRSSFNFSHHANQKMFDNSINEKWMLPPLMQQNNKIDPQKHRSDPAGVFHFGGKGSQNNMWQIDHRAEVSSQPPQLLTGTEFDSLSKQVWETFAENQQLESTFRAKIKLKDCISKVIWNVLPTCRLFVVGSSLSGFGANSSDVDMCLMVTPRDLDQRNEAQAVLRLLQRELNNCGFVEKMELIKAKVPILKFRDAYSSIDVDLNCNNSVGIRNTHLLNAYSQLDWRVRPLVLVVKLWAQHHHINNAKDMTISSYSLVLMVLHYLQCGVSPPLLPCLHEVFPEKFNFVNHVFKMPVTERMPPFTSNNHQSLGELFLGFLDYFANQFTFIENTISVRTGRILPTDECRYARTKKNDFRMWKYLCIEEPFDLTNTARSVYDEIVFEKVKNVFKESFALLNEKKDLTKIFQRKNQGGI